MRPSCDGLVTKCDKNPIFYAKWHVSGKNCDKDVTGTYIDAKWRVIFNSVTKIVTKICSYFEFYIILLIIYYKIKDIQNGSYDISMNTCIK